MKAGPGQRYPCHAPSAGQRWSPRSGNPATLFTVASRPLIPVGSVTAASIVGRSLRWVTPAAARNLATTATALTLSAMNTAIVGEVTSGNKREFKSNRGVVAIPHGGHLSAI